MKIRFFIVLCVIVLYFGCSKDGTVKEEYLVLLPKSTSSLPLIMAIDNGILDGVRFEYEFFTSHPQALSRLIRGDADFLYTGTTQGWENQMSGGPLVTVTSGVWGISYLMGKELISDWADLKGKTIVLPFVGSPLDYQTRALLKNAGLNLTEDVEISYSPFAPTIALLVTGKADYAPLPEPLASRLELQGKLKRIFSYKTSWGELVESDGASPQVSLFVTRAFLAKDESVIRRFLENWRIANDLLLQQPEIFSKKYAEVLGFSAEEVNQSIKNSHLEVVTPVDNKRLSFQYLEKLQTFFPDFQNNLKQEFFYAGE